jgi:hypothetical protein
MDVVDDQHQPAPTRHGKQRVSCQPPAGSPGWSRPVARPAAIRPAPKRDHPAGPGR